jgi:hypothetical protein
VARREVADLFCDVDGGVDFLVSHRAEERNVSFSEQFFVRLRVVEFEEVRDFIQALRLLHQRPLAEEVLLARHADLPQREKGERRSNKRSKKRREPL